MATKCHDDDNHGGNKDKESPSESNEEKEEDNVTTVVLGTCMPATIFLPPTMEDEMKVLFLTLDFSQTVAQKLMEDQGIDSPLSLASLFDEDITAICDVMRRPGGQVGGRTPDRREQISILMAKNIKLTEFIFNLIE